MPIVKDVQQSGEEQITILIEVDGPPEKPQGMFGEDVLGPKETFEEVQGLFRKGLGLIRTCATEVIESIKKLDEATQPDELEIQLAVKLDAEAQAAFLTKIGTGAQMQVSMKWVAEKKKE